MCRQSKTRDPFTTSHGPAGAQPPSEKQGSITCDSRKTNAITPNMSQFLLSPQLCLLSMVPGGISCPLGCAPSQFPVWPPAHSLAGLCEKQKRPWPRVSPGHQYQNDSCVTNTVSSPKAKQNLAPYYLLCRK